MMKKIFLTTSVFLILGLLWGCREIPPVIDYSRKAIGLLDTTYIVSPIPTAVNKTIFVEDITGVRCNNCPKAAARVHEIDSTNLHKTVAMGVYPFSLSTLTSPYDGFEVLNTTVADDIFKDIYNSPGAIPGGGVNRKVFSGETAINTSITKWKGYADILKTETSPLILEAEVVENNTTSGKIKVKIKATFTQKYDTALNLSLFVTESKIKSRQTMPDGKFNDTYEHNHVLRSAITNFTGTPLKINAASSGNYEAGRVFEQEFEFVMDAKWVTKNCDVVILVNRFDLQSKEVLQAFKLKLQ